jgi:branched-chain amino acid transport system permease protein
MSQSPLPASGGESAVIRYLPWVLFAVAAAAPLLGGTYMMKVASLIGVYAILALGLNIFFGYCGQVSFGHAAFFAIGAYVAAYLTMHFAVPFYLSTIIGAAVTGIVAIGVGLPLMRIRGHYLALATLSFGEVVYLTLQRWTSVTGGENGLDVPEPIALGVSFDGTGFYYLILACTVLSFLACEAIVNSRVGWAMRAMGQDELGARSMGINITRYKTMGFMIAGLLAGLAGPLFAFNNRWVAPENFSVNISILALVMIVIGGFSSNVGSIIGAIFVVAMPELLRAVVGPYASIEMLLWGVLIIVSLYYMPAGIAGLFEREGAGRAALPAFLRRWGSRKGPPPPHGKAAPAASHASSRVAP